MKFIPKIKMPSRWPRVPMPKLNRPPSRNITVGPTVRSPSLPRDSQFPGSVTNSPLPRSRRLSTRKGNSLLLAAGSAAVLGLVALIALAVTSAPTPGQPPHPNPQSQPQPAQPQPPVRIGPGGMIISDIDGNYGWSITEKKTEIPFTLTPQLVETAKTIVAPFRRDQIRERAKAIFDWIQTNVPYDEQQRLRIERNQRGEYRGAEETFDDKTGVCGEQAVLYVAMARVGGLQAKWVKVDVDFRGTPVRHACAAVNVDVGETILVDPAYHTFDIKHRVWKAWDDDKVIEHFRLINP